MTLAARGYALNQDPVVYVKIRNTGAHLFNNTDSFMPQNTPLTYRWNIAFQNMQIGSTNGRFSYSHYGIGRFPEGWFWHFFIGSFTWTVIYQGFHRYILLCLQVVD